MLNLKEEKKYHTQKNLLFMLLTISTICAVVAFILDAITSLKLVYSYIFVGLALICAIGSIILLPNYMTNRRKKLLELRKERNKTISKKRKKIAKGEID